MKDFTVIAEIDCVHIGDIDRAKELAELAKISGADVLKTQKRNPEESTRPELKDKPHPKPYYSYGNTYLEHRIKVELPIKKHAELKKHCEDIGIEYATSVWDITSASEVIPLNPRFIKIPSALNQNEEMFELLLKEYKGEIHISTGMLNLNERKKLYKKLRPYQNRVVVYLCTSGYPVPFENIHLLEISILKKLFPKVGFSNHGHGIAMEPVAYNLGARYFERHFIDDRMFRHNDASCSLEPSELYKMVRDLYAIQKALTYKPKYLEAIEQEQKCKLQIK